MKRLATFTDDRQEPPVLEVEAASCQERRILDLSELLSLGFTEGFEKLVRQHSQEVSPGGYRIIRKTMPE